MHVTTCLAILFYVLRIILIVNLVEKKNSGGIGKNIRFFIFSPKLDLVHPTLWVSLIRPRLQRHVTGKRVREIGTRLVQPPEILVPKLSHRQNQDYPVTNGHAILSIAAYLGTRNH